jgi:MurNAc alpha-1-phosphate uridylyltransferase
MTVDSVNNEKITPVKAMILAAGRGNRFRPLTDTVPKPLIEVCGKPLIEYHIEKLVKAGVNEIVINHAWLGHKIEAALGNGERWGVKIHYSAEPAGGLETAGGIIKALPLLGELPFLVINGDVYSDFAFESLVQQSLTMRSETEIEAFLMLVPSPGHNVQGDFGLLENRQVTENGGYTFSGMSVLHPKLFSGMDVGFIKLAPLLRQAMQQQRVIGDVFDGYWSDVGTFERLKETEAVVCPLR